MSKQARERMNKLAPVAAAASGIAAVALFPAVSPQFIALIERVGFPGVFLWLVLRQHGPLLTEIKEQLAALNSTLEKSVGITERRMDELERRIDRLENSR